MNTLEFKKILDMGKDCYYNYMVFDEMTAEHAYLIAEYHNNNRDNYPYYDELALVIVNNSVDSSIHLYWAKAIKTNMNMIFNSFLSNYSVSHAVKWIIDIDYDRNNELKEKIIINDQVNDYIHHMSMQMAKEYSLDNFYNDLPIDYKLGVII